MWPRAAILHSAIVIYVICVSFAAILIRLADAPPLTIASYRLSIAALVMLSWAAWSRIRSSRVSTKQVSGGSSLNKRDIALILFSSVCLALHFAFWTASLDYTSVANSVVLVTTTPFMVALASRVLFGEPIYLYAMLGISVGIIGGLVLAAGDAGKPGQLMGDMLAFLGAVSVVGYLMAGRRLRRRISASTYNVWVYSGTALILVIAASLSGAPFTGFTQDTYVALLLLALVPQLIGHSLLNWSLAYATATVVAISVTAEPVIATLLAIPVLGEWPSQTSVAGGLLILMGIYLAVRPRT